MPNTYEQALKDHEYLWKEYAPASDMTGGYVDSDDLERLLHDPNKVTARECLKSQIAYWFQIGPDQQIYIGEAWKTDPEVKEIAERSGSEDDLAHLCAR